MHDSCFFFSNVLAGPRRSFDEDELTGNANDSIQIRLMQFTGPRFANKAVVQLNYFGIRDHLFKTHIEIMGCYLVVLLAHNAACGENRTETIVIPRDGPRKRAPRPALPREDKELKCQTIYLVDCGSGRVIFVRSPFLTAFAPLFDLLTSIIAKARFQRYIFPSLSVHI